MKKPSLIITLFLNFFFAQAANAIEINPDGHGEAIIVPYFTTHNDLNTYVTVSNNSPVIKAVKVKFMDGKHHLSMKSFNLYLKPWETFAFGVLASTDDSNQSDVQGSIHFDENAGYCIPGLTSGTQFSATLELIPGVYLNTLEGMIEVLEMGEIQNDSLTCNDIINLWNNGAWADGNTDLYMSPPAGQLSSSVSIIDVINGFQFSTETTALNDFYPQSDSTNYHTEPPSNHPSLYDASTSSQGYVFESGIDALSATLAKSQLINQFNIEAIIAAQTEWVISLPTKKNHRIPFDCSSIDSISIRDRQGNPFEISTETDVKLCHEINVLKITASESPSILNSDYATTLGLNTALVTDSIPETGLMIVNLTSDEAFTVYATDEVSDAEVAFNGIPVLGFAIQKLYNANAQPGLLATYGTSYKHTFIDKNTTTLN